MSRRMNLQSLKRSCRGLEPCCLARNWRTGCTVGTSRSAATRSRFTFTACGGNLEAMPFARCVAWVTLCPKHELDSRASAGRLDYFGGHDVAARGRGHVSARVDRDIDAV